FSVAFGVCATYTGVPGGSVLASRGSESSSCVEISVEALRTKSTMALLSAAPSSGASLGSLIFRLSLALMESRLALLGLAPGDHKRLIVEPQAAVFLQHCLRG